MIRVAVLSAEPLGPSTRHRWTHAAPWMEAAGIAPEVVLLPAGPASRGEAFARAGEAAVTVLQRRLLRRADFRRLARSVRRLVYDFDDAMPFRVPWREAPLSTVRANRFLRACSGADAVVAGSEELAGLARPCAPQALFVAPTPVDPDRYGPPPAATAEGEFRVGWIGSRATLPYLRAIAAPLARVCAAGRGVRLVVVADAAPELDGVPVEWIPWSEEGEREALRRMDCGLMPLTDDPWSRGKCGFKLLQYGATGLPAVASPVGANRVVIEHGRTGFLAGEGREWEESLLRLARDRGLRERMGAAARRQVESRWSVRVLAPALAGFLRAVAEREPAPARRE